MASIKIKNFKFGLDTRRSELESQAGTLLRLVNAHVNQGGEIEKRFGFFRQPRPTSTYGAQPTSAGIVIFGSRAFMTAEEDITAGNLGTGVYQYKVTIVTADGEFYSTIGSASFTATGSKRALLINVPTGAIASGVLSRKVYRTEAGGSTYKLAGTISGNVTTTFNDNVADGSLGATLGTLQGDELIYQRLTHPDGSSTMHGVNFSECYGGKAWVVARFADMDFCYFDGVLIKDFTNGLVLPHFLVSPLPRGQIANHIASIADDTVDYEGAIDTVATASRARASNVATIVTSSAHGLSTGDSVTIAGLGGSGYNVSVPVAVTVTNTTTFTYANVGSDEGTTADTGGTVTKSEYVIIEDGVGVDFTLTESETSANGDLSTPTVKREEIAFQDGLSSAASFRIMGGSDIVATAAAATGTLTRDGTDVSNNDFVIIGSKRYTFKTTPAVEGDVKRGVSALDSLTNLKKAINHESGNGTNYICFAAHPYVTAGALTTGDTVMPLTATAGSNGNSTVLTESLTPAAWVFSGTDLAGGAGNCVASIKVISPSQTVTELLSAAVDYVTSNELTAIAVAAVINANTSSGLTHGYTATVETDSNLVSIFSAENASPMPNGYVLQVTVGGNVCVGDCMFFFTVEGPNSATITINAGGKIVLPTTPSYPAGFAASGVDTFAELYAYIETTINAQSGFHDIVAKASTDFVQLSRIVTRSDDIALPVTVVFNPSNDSLGVTFGSPPTAPSPLQVTVPANVFDIIDNGAGQGSLNQTGVTVVGATVTGGIGPYTYQWQEETPGSAKGAGGGGTGSQNSGYDRWFMGVTASNAAQVIFTITGTTSGGLVQGNYIGRFVVRVTDAVGTVVISSTIVVNIYVDQD